MAWAGDELWFVNTRFSCLCTLGRSHSFVPRWRPSFISALAPEDRCHLNGMEMVDGRPRDVTALGDTNTGGGWRDNKARGGVLIDMRNGEFVAQGLSMPHSPRWYRGALGARVGHRHDRSGRSEHRPLPAGGRAAGIHARLSFLGRYAFVGLSQVRETAVFSGIPITERLSERISGVWVVDIISGQTVAFLKFEDAVQEVFAVQVVPNLRHPELIVADDPLLNDSFVLPDDSLREVPDTFRSSGRAASPDHLSADHVTTELPPRCSLHF